MARRERQGEQSCYISAPAGLDAGGLRRALKDLSVRIVQEGETPAPGESLIVTLREALQSADFVCGVVGVGETSPNVLFELGLAAGLARPVFVVRPGFGSMPLALEGYPVVQAELDDVETLKFHLELFLRNVRRTGHVVVARSQRVKPSRRSPPRLDDLRNRIQEPRRPSERDLEQVVLEALQRAGMEAVSRPRYDDAELQPDLAVWLPEAPPDLGNPLLIELVGASRPPRGAAEQARRYLEIARVRCALVISEASALDPPVEINGGYIFRLTIAEFLDALERSSLVQRLIDQRNRIVHGVR